MRVPILASKWMKYPLAIRRAGLSAQLRFGEHNARFVSLLVVYTSKNVQKQSRIEKEGMQ
jgi:hypothetical protein